MTKTKPKLTKRQVAFILSKSPSGIRRFDETTEDY